MYHEETGHPVIHIFYAEIVRGEMVLDEEEILDIRWFDRNEIQAMNKEKKLRNPWIVPSIEKLESSQA